MFRAFVALLRMIWPFVKESVLKDGTFRDWVRRNKNVCIFIVFQIIMLLCMFWLVDMLRIARQSEQLLAKELIELRVEQRVLKKEHGEMKIEVDAERETAQRFRQFIAEACLRDRLSCEFMIQETIRVTGPQTPEVPQTGIPHEWCELVQTMDLTDNAVRLRYLKDCFKNPHLPEPTSEAAAPAADQVPTPTYQGES